MHHLTEHINQDILYLRNYQNILLSVLSRLEITYKFAQFLGGLGSSVIIKIKRKKLTEDYNCFSLIFRAKVIFSFVRKINFNMRL